MKLYAMAVAAWRTKQDGQAEVKVHSGVALFWKEEDLERDALASARQIFPESEGWHDHLVIPTEIPQGMNLPPYRITWQAEEIQS